MTGKYRRDEPPAPDTRFGRRASAGWAATALTERNFEVVGAVEKVAAELGTTPTAVALAWVRSRRGVTSVIIGPRTLRQLEENLPGFDLELPPEVLSLLNDVSRPADRVRLPRR